MGFKTKTVKIRKLLRHPTFAWAAIRHQVAAAVEHLEAIRLSQANALIDIGANKGQFSLAFRGLRREAQIVALEPFPKAADHFERVFAADPGTKLVRVAISDVRGEAEFHVADREDSSSLLPLGPGQKTAFGIGTSSVIRVPTDTLESCVELDSLPRPILMKIDVQGAELKVLEGITHLDMIDLIYVELSFVELYAGQPLFDEVSSYLNRKDFTLAGVFNQVVTDAFGPTQADFLFKRKVRDKQA